MEISSEITVRNLRLSSLPREPTQLLAQMKRQANVHQCSSSSGQGSHREMNQKNQKLLSMPTGSEELFKFKQCNREIRHLKIERASVGANVSVHLCICVRKLNKDVHVLQAARQITMSRHKIRERKRACATM